MTDVLTVPLRTKKDNPEAALGQVLLADSALGPRR
jgi:hypothetical protein